MSSPNFDTWEDTEAAVRAIYKLVRLHCETKPSQKADPKVIKIWDDEMREIGKWATSVHTRRIALNIKMQDEQRKQRRRGT